MYEINWLFQAHEALLKAAMSPEGAARRAYLDLASFYESQARRWDPVRRLRPVQSSASSNGHPK